MDLGDESARVVELDDVHRRMAEHLTKAMLKVKLFEQDTSHGKRARAEDGDGEDKYLCPVALLVSHSLEHDEEARTPRCNGGYQLNDAVAKSIAP